MARNLTGSQAGFPGYVAADTYYSDPATAVVPDSMHNEHLLGVIAYVLENLGAGGGGSGDALVANPLSQFAATTSAQLRGVLSDETGTGLAYFQGGDIGTPSAGVGTNLTGTAAGLTAGIATLANALKSATTTINVSSATAPTVGQVLTATSDSAATWQTAAGGGDALVANPLSQFAATTSAQLRGVLSDETGTGLAYFQDGDLGTPSAGVATNITALNATQLTTGTVPAPRVGQYRAVADAADSPTNVDGTVAFSSLTAARVVTLPAASSFSAGQTLIIADNSGSCSTTNTITINRAGADTINGATSFLMTSAYGQALLISDGTSKWVLRHTFEPRIVNFTASGSLPDPGAGCKMLRIRALGAGGGGASGRKHTSAAARAGGSGGSAGAWVDIEVPYSSVSSWPVTITIGAGGAGGAAQTSDGTSGNAGTAGGDTIFDAVVTAKGGLGGTGGGSSSASGGEARIGSLSSLQTAINIAAQNTYSAAGGWSGTAATAVTAGSVGHAGSGGGGGGLTTGNATMAGLAGGANAKGTAGGAGGASGGAVGTAGGAGDSSTPYAFPGGSGGGGAGSSTSAAYAGGAGGNYGAGGGGGTAGTSAVNDSGVGGAGAGGFMQVIYK